MDEYAVVRERMVREQLESRDVRDARVLEAMRSVPRHEFVPQESRNLAYADAPLPIGDGQTISQPYIVAFMTELLEVQAADRILEVGTGSGYQAAVLSLLAGEVYTLERISRLASESRARLARLGFHNVQVIESDGSCGYPDQAPFDGIIVTAAAPKAPTPLKGQLADGGRMVVPVGSREGQVLERWTRRGDRLEEERIAPVAFVPLVGEHGWPPDREVETKKWRWF